MHLDDSATLLNNTGLGPMPSLKFFSIHLYPIKVHFECLEFLGGGVICKMLAIAWLEE